MTEQLRDDVALRYLLHDLSGPELQAFEVRLIEDAGAQEQVAAIEVELVDDYVVGRLSPEARTRFETYYLATSGGRDKVEQARRLLGELRLASARDASSRAAPRRRWQGLAVAGAAAVLLLAVGVRWWPRAASTDVPSFVLVAGATRAPGAPQIVAAAASAGTVRLELQLPAESQQPHRAVMFTPDGVSVWRGDDLRARQRDGGTILPIVVDFAGIEPGDYVIRASRRMPGGAWQDVADYTFRFERPTR